MVELPILARPLEPDPDPISETVEYVKEDWFRQLVPVQTTCYSCKSVSPIIHVPHGDVLAFGNPRLLKASGGRKRRDITKEAVQGFARVGWKFQFRRAYCPACKGLGSG